MAEITRQHLEDAALAAGITLRKEYQSPGDSWKFGLIIYTNNDSLSKPCIWRPHIDDGDAFRLMVSTRGAIEVLKHYSWAAAADYDGDGPGALMEVDHDGTQADAARAAREAVVLCAAEVGRRMREGGQ